MKTAIQWLEEMFNNSEIPNSSMLFKQAKQMEKEQIMDAHEEGFYSPPFRMSRRREAEQYYNKTFKK